MLNRGQTSNTENNQLYFIENNNINKLTKKASTYFNAFRNRDDQQSLTSSIKYFEDAIKLAENDDNKLDLAHCLRRYASTVIRNHSDPDSASKASACLSRAINIYNDQEMQTDIIKLEKARAIDLQRHVAHSLKNGTLLEECAAQLLQLYSASEMNNYVVNAYEALFHCAFAKGELKQAQTYHNLAATNAISAGIDYKYDAHELKLNMARLEIMNATSLSTEIQSQFFKDNIEENFWKTYDENKKAYKNDPSQRNRLNLVKDLMQLFIIRIKRAQLGFDHNQRPAEEYVVNQAKRIFGHRHIIINRIKAKLGVKIEEIKDKHSIPLSYQYYGDVNPPGISITPEQLNLVLSQAGIYSRDQSPQTSIGQNPAAFYSPQKNDPSVNELATPNHTPKI